MPKRKPTKVSLDILRRQAREIHEVRKDHAEEFLEADVGSIWRVRDNTPGFEVGRWEYWVAPKSATAAQVLKEKASRYIGDWEFEVECVRKRNPDVTRQEWQQALKKDQADLKKYEGYLRRLERGEKVGNMTISGVKKTISGLRQTIRNKEALIAQKSRQPNPIAKLKRNLTGL